MYPKYPSRKKKRKLQKLSNKGQQLDVYVARVYEIKQFLFALTLRRVDTCVSVCMCTS